MSSLPFAPSRVRRPLLRAMQLAWKSTCPAATDAMPFMAPAWFVDFQRADDIIALVASMRGQNNAWFILGMHGVGAGTHTSFVDANEHRQLTNWLADQRGWLTSATLLEAAHQPRKTGDSHEPK